MDMKFDLRGSYVAVIFQYSEAWKCVYLNNWAVWSVTHRLLALHGALHSRRGRDWRLAWSHAGWQRETQTCCHLRGKSWWEVFAFVLDYRNWRQWLYRCCYAHFRSGFWLLCRAALRLGVVWKHFLHMWKTKRDTDSVLSLLEWLRSATLRLWCLRWGLVESKAE